MTKDTLGTCLIARGLGTFLAVRAMEVSYLITYISMRAIQLGIGIKWDHNGVKWDHKIICFDNDLANTLGSDVTPEDDTSGYYGKPFWVNSLSCNGLRKCLQKFVYEPKNQKPS